MNRLLTETNYNFNLIGTSQNKQGAPIIAVTLLIYCKKQLLHFNRLMLFKFKKICKCMLKQVEFNIYILLTGGLNYGFGHLVNTFG